MHLSLSLSLGSTMGGVGRFSLASFMAGQADGFYFRFTEAGTLWQDVGATTPVTATGQSIARADDQRDGAGSPHNGTQATAGSQPKFQAGGSDFDGLDDYLITNYRAGTGANFIVAKATVPATVASYQAIFGAQDNTPGNRFRIGFSPAGNLLVSIGTQGGIAGSAADYRGQTLVFGASFDGTTLRIFEGTALANSLSQSGVPTQAVDCLVGAMSNGGSPVNNFGGDIAAIVVGRQFLDLETYQKIADAIA